MIFMVAVDLGSIKKSNLTQKSLYPRESEKVKSNKA